MFCFDSNSGCARSVTFKKSRNLPTIYETKVIRYIIHQMVLLAYNWFVRHVQKLELKKTRNLKFSVFHFFAFHLVQKKSDVSSWPTYQPTMSHLIPIMTYLPKNRKSLMDNHCPCHSWQCKLSLIPVFLYMRSFNVEL